MKQFKTESKRILDLMINSIYTNKEIFLRELLSNASDAIDKLKFISLTEEKAVKDFKIMLSFDKEKGTITIEDNGIGMNQADLEKNLGVIAESGTLAFKKENKSEEELIGQFGVGFYSAFMVADKIEVFTKKYGEEKAYKWESRGVEGYEITETEKQDVGTKIVLSLKQDGEEFKYSDFLSEYKIKSLVKEYSDYIRYPINMQVTKTVKKEDSSIDKPEFIEKVETETLNSMLPLWKKKKSEVTEQALSEFYQREFRDFNSPLKSIYAKIEGTVTYDTLLFFPEKAPFDYYTNDFKKGLKLYSAGILIMDKCEELLPDYFGFVKGVVDSSDLSLNISREILQQDRQVKAIATTLEKRIISELKKLLETEREKYEKLFKEFGLRIKFGIYEGFGVNKDKLKDLVLFYSLKDKKLVTLAEYVKSMPLSQKEIYYACGSSIEAVERLPKVKKALASGLDVLCFKDGVDEFITKILNEYQEKKFKAVQDSDLELGSEDDKKRLEEKNSEYSETLQAVKELLKDKVKDVKLSLSLLDYPVCITAGGELSIEMEKVLNAMPNSDGKVSAEKILEISADHPVTEKLNSLLKTDKEKFDKLVNVLYCEARLIEGLNIENLGEFISDLSSVIL